MCIRDRSTRGLQTLSLFLSFFNLRKILYPIENILKGYLSIANLNFDKNFILYELCWLARMYIFEMKHPYYGQYFPNKEFYYENFINLSTQVEDKSNFYKNYPDKFFEGVIANEY